MRKVDPTKPRRLDVKVEKTIQRAVPKFKLLMDLRPEGQRGPGPSKTMYRLTRIWKKMWVRRLALVVLPVALLIGAGWKVATSPWTAAFVADQRAAVIAALSERPEFAVRGYRVTGAGEDLTRRIAEIVNLPKGASTLTFDVDALRHRVSEIPAVREAHVTLGADGLLAIAIDERIARALWRDGEDQLWLIDDEGVQVGSAANRAGYADLPLVLGAEAPAAVTEALALFESAPDLKPRLRALVRVGQRRWNVELDRGLTIMLPEDGAEAALGRVMAWHYGEDLLDRGLAAVDMRVPARPALRMTSGAHERLKLREAARKLPGEDT